MKKEQYERFAWVLDFILKRDWPRVTGLVCNKIYDDAFFEEMRGMKIEAYRNVAKILDRNLAFQSVFDIGCGAGQLLQEFAKLGKRCVGCEYSEAGIRRAGETITVFHADAGKEIHLSQHFDLVTCVEVAEHLDRRCSNQLVENCVTYGERVFFTAAPPGQTGVGHINLQPREFWFDLFARNGFEWKRALSAKVAQEMRQEGVVSWIVENLLVFERSGRP
jgi:SAM-dependent methyltransferase